MNFTFFIVCYDDSSAKKKSIEGKLSISLNFQLPTYFGERLNAKLEEQDEVIWEHEVDQILRVIHDEMAKHVGLYPIQRDLAYVLHLVLTKNPHFFMNQNSD